MSSRFPWWAAALGLVLAGCGGGGSSTAQTTLPKQAPAKAAGHGASHHPAGHHSVSWTRFGYNAARTNAAPRGLRRRQIGRLAEKRVHLNGTVDSSPIYLNRVRVRGHKRNLLVLTTTYGRTLGLNAGNGAPLWSFTPASYQSLAGSEQITTATPVADPDRRFVYAASPDGQIHKLRTKNGRQVTSGQWPAAITLDPATEKIASALNVSGRYVLATMGGYIGDAPPYQGKVVAIDRSSGQVANVFNSLCSNRREIIDPSTCAGQRSAIWGRAGAVVDPATHDVFATSSNGPFNGSTNWADSVLQLSPGVGSLMRHYTPTDQQVLESTDADLGSTSPALLPAPGHGKRTRYLLQGGKDGKLRLLKVPNSLFGVTGSAGQKLGGEVQILSTPGGAPMFTAPAVLHRGRSTRVFVATGGGTTAYHLRHGRLRPIWHNGTAGTSPVVAGKLLWVYDPGGGLDVYRLANGRLVRRLPAPPGHWNSPIVANGRAYLPSGDANDHATTGTLSIYHRR